MANIRCKTQSWTNTIITLLYGELPIAHSSRWLDDTIIDIIVDCEDNFYEIRNTLNGQLVAYYNKNNQ